MLRIAIYGTKMGLSAFYPAGSVEGFDIRKYLSGQIHINDSFFSIFNSPDIRIITKYTIKHDYVGRSNGFLAVSLEISKNADYNSREILDRITENYCMAHAQNDILKAFNEDWDKVFGDYKEKLIGDNIHALIASGSKKDALLKYSDDELDTLLKCSLPEKYRYIFLVPKSDREILLKSELKDITSEIIFDNQDYIIEISQKDDYSCKINGVETNKPELKGSQKLEIVFEKKGYKEQRFSSNYLNKLIETDIFAVTRNGNTFSISPKPFEPLTKGVDFRLINLKNVVLESATGKTIELGSRNKKIVFSGSEINESWSIKHSKHKLEHQSFNPKTQSSITIRKKQNTRSGNSKMKWTTYLAVLILAGIVGLIVSLLFKNGNGKDEIIVPYSTPHHYQTETKKYTEQIKQYCDGMGLFKDTLKYYDSVVNTVMPKDCILLPKIDLAIRIRKALNGDQKDAIDKLIGEEGISEDQKEFLESINADTDTYGVFKQIKDRADKSLSKLQNEFNSKLSEKSNNAIETQPGSTTEKPLSKKEIDEEIDKFQKDHNKLKEVQKGEGRYKNITEKQKGLISNHLNQR